MLSVRIVQPSIGLRLRLFAAAPICWTLHVSPPSCETPTWSGAGAALGLSSCPRKAAQHTYTVPKNALEEALSAQTCSLSEKVVDDCFEMTTGGFQAAFPAAPPVAATAALSVRETAIASKPLNASSDRVAPRFEVRFA